MRVLARTLIQSCTRGEGGGTLKLVPVRSRQRQRASSCWQKLAGRGGSGQADRDSQQGSFRVALGPEVSREALGAAAAGSVSRVAGGEGSGCRWLCRYVKKEQDMDIL